MGDDDAMDFSFDTVSKGKKKTFNFEKLDMDFNLDGEFDKISSFKVDMSDLDFSCSPKKHPKSKENKGGDMPDLDFSCSPKNPTKPKENKGGESSGAKEKKQNNFDFSFDFNEMDSFNLDSSLMKGDKTSTSNLNKKVTSDGSDSGVAKESKPKDDERAHASNDSMAMKPPASEMVETSKFEVVVGNQRDLGSIQDGSVSKVSSSGKLDMLIETTLGISTTSTEENDQERELPEKTKPSELKSQDINNRPSKSVGQNDSNQDTSLDQHTEVYSPGAKGITGSVGKQNVINKATYLGSDGVKLLLENSSLHQISKSESSDGEAVKFGSSTQAEATDEPEPVKSDASFENNTKAVLLKQISHDNVENQNSTLEGHLDTASSKHVVDKVMLMKDKEIKGIQSKFFGKLEDNNIPSKHNLLTAGTKGASFGSKRIGDMQLGSITKANDNFKSNDSEFGTKSVHGSTPATSEPVREEIVLLGDNGDVKISSKARSHVNSSCLTKKTARHATQMPVNLQAHNSDKESFKNLRVNIEGNKLFSVKAVKITPALSGFKTSKTGGTNKVLTTSIRQKETNSSGNALQTELQGITASKSDYRIDNAENQKPATFSLKRKTMEVWEADLVPLRSLKRLSQSPSKSSSYNECPEKVVEKVESRPNSLHCNSPAHGLESPPEINLMEVKLPASVLVEDNGNVEKAEAYSKELEDICNMLKKKHEEAKELIVRALVNNNNLLMLNHPIYEEKISSTPFLSFPLFQFVIENKLGYSLTTVNIRKVQKLTLQLMSKGIQT